MTEHYFRPGVPPTHTYTNTCTHLHTHTHTHARTHARTHSPYFRPVLTCAPLPVLQICVDLYRKAMAGMRKHMVTKLTMVNGQGEWWIPANVVNAVKSWDTLTNRTKWTTQKSNALEHLTCFVPGMLTLGR